MRKEPFMAEVQIKQKIELHPLLDEFFQEWEIVEVEVTDAEIILRKPEHVEHSDEIEGVVQKTHGTIKIKDKEIIKRIAESEEFSVYQ
jgi:hypothetical protein